MSQRIAIEALPDGPDIALPPVRVGSVSITSGQIAQEMQYHSAPSLDDALRQAALALVVRELLNQRADELGLTRDKEDEEARLSHLLEYELDEELDNALRHLPEGLHGRPLASRYGWHLVWIERRVEGQIQPFDKVADRVRHTLREQHSRRALRHYLLALAESYGVEGVDLDTSGALMQ